MNNIFYNQFQNQTGIEKMEKGENKTVVPASERELTVPEANRLQKLLVHQSQNQIEAKKEEKMEGCDIAAPAFEIMPELDFQRNLCIYPVETEKFDRKYSWSDYLIIRPGHQVIGKGLDIELKDCRIYISQGDDRYTFDLGEDGDNKGIFHKIPPNVQFVIIGDGEEVFAVTIEYSEEISVYKLGNDVNMDIYFETDLYRGKYNLYYGYISREPKYNFYSCNITGDPRTGSAFFRTFAKTVNFGRKEILAQKTKSM